MLIIGIDLGKSFSQVCYYNFKSKEPESVNFAPQDSLFRVPTVVLLQPKDNSWLAGDTAVKYHSLGEGILYDDILSKATGKEPVKTDGVVVMPIEFLTVYLDFLISTVKAVAKDEDIKCICITVEDFGKAFLNIIKKALLNLIPADCKVVLSSKVEAYAYYALCQPDELTRLDMVCFDYDENGLVFHRIATMNDRGVRIIMSESKDFSEQVSYPMADEELSQALLEIARTELEARNASTVYLTGCGFGEDIKAEKFINYVCTRRRVFAGQNLYAKGACYQAYEEYLGERFKNSIFACSGRITTGIEMKICDRGAYKILRMVKPGVNWYVADCSYDFIVDDCNEIEFFLSPVNARDKRLLRISLSELPVRPSKMTRITVSLSFVDDRHCHLMIEDKGFGDFVKSSGRIINEDIVL